MKEKWRGHREVFAKKFKRWSDLASREWTRSKNLDFNYFYPFFLYGNTWHFYEFRFKRKHEKLRNVGAPKIWNIFMYCSSHRENVFIISCTSIETKQKSFTFGTLEAISCVKNRHQKRTINRWHLLLFICHLVWLKQGTGTSYFDTLQLKKKMRDILQPLLLIKIYCSWV